MGFKYFIGYKDGKKVRLLSILLPKTSGYRRDFDETKYMTFLIKDVELFEKYEIWEKVSNSIKKGFHSEPVYNENYFKTKIKLYEGKISSNFHCDKIRSEGFHCIYLLIILIDSVF